MVSKKRLRYGEFNGFRAPVVPKAPRSIRKNPHKKLSPGNEICPFELLAAVAGKLLQESEGSASSTSPEQKEQITIPKDIVKQEPSEVKLKRTEDLLHSDNDSGIEHASIVTTSDFLKEVSTNVKLEVSDSKNGVIGTPSHGDVCDADMDTNIMPNLHTETIEKQTEDLLDKVINPHVLNSVHLPYYSDPVPSDCFVNRRDKNVKIGIRDDDENSFSCNHYSSKMKAYRLQSRSGYRRIRKMLTSKYWKTAPKLKDYEQFSNRRKRKLFHNSSKKPEYVQEKYVQETSSESISNSPERHPSKRVKFSIKSFKVPELYLEMPETATVGSLKRTVMEALTAILGGELHVGVLLQGKKVRDDNRTLQQTGISLNSETLGFMLEPTLPEPSQSPVEKQPPMSPPECDNHQPLSTSPDSPITDVGFSNSSPDPPSETKSDDQIEKSKEEIAADPKAIVPITSANPEILSIVPANQKLNKRSELSQRRTRRPFSVSEVESLVEAVETLGTGRWRDVKIRAFDDANHRTYVDLKDKWKTLVHTASISPQQRRGEPVPQNLLDRVLAAHAFWTQNQPKKHHGEPVQTVGTPVQVCLEMEG